MANGLQGSEVEVKESSKLYTQYEQSDVPKSEKSRVFFRFLGQLRCFISDVQ